MQTRREALQEEIKLERNLTVMEPKILGAAVVIPLKELEPVKKHQIDERQALYESGARPPTGDGMKRDDAIEAVGMQVAMDYEKMQGWNPEDISGENHGFDFRSTLYKDGALEDIRYIVVKARARSGTIRLSSNEWKKARRFGVVA